MGMKGAMGMFDKKQWFRERKWGVFMHYLDGIVNGSAALSSYGKETSWDECVNEFDVHLLARQLHEVGAGYLVFTVMQATKHMIAPNETYTRLLGGDDSACCKRDLIQDLIDALDEYGIPLFLYFTGDGPFDDPVAGEKLRVLKNGERYITPQFVDSWTAVLRECSMRYGSGIKGWWIDSLYNCFYPGADNPDIGRYREAALAGNPDALFAANYYGCNSSYSEVELLDFGKVLLGDWYHEILPPTPYCDYTAGELNYFDAYPKAYEIDGAVPHVLSFLGIPVPPVSEADGWGKPTSKYSPEYMRRYVDCFNRMGGVVSIDCAIYRDGLMSETQLEVLRALKPVRA